jgi:hypothetical protein
MSKLNFAREIAKVAKRDDVKDQIGDLLPMASAGLRVGGAKWKRVSRMRETMADIFWCAATAPRSTDAADNDSYGLNFIPNLIAFFDEDQRYLTYGQVKPLVERIVCATFVHQLLQLGPKEKLDEARAARAVDNVQFGIFESPCCDSILAMQAITCIGLLRKDETVPTQIAQEATLLAQMIKSSSRFRTALENLRKFGNAAYEDELVKATCDDGRVREVDSDLDVLGPRLAWMFAKQWREKKEGNVAPLARRFAFASVLEQLCRR